MKIEVDKRSAFTFIVVALIVASALIVNAYNSGFSGGSPSIMGHSSDEIMVEVDGSPKTLQSAIDDGDLAGGGSLPAGLKWKKICTSNGGPVVSYQHTITCSSVGGAYGEDIHYAIKNSGTSSASYCLKSSGVYLYSGVVTACTEDMPCTSEGQYCVKNFNEVPDDRTYFSNSGWCGLISTGLYLHQDYNTNGVIYRCAYST